MSTQPDLASVDRALESKPAPDGGRAADKSFRAETAQAVLVAFARTEGHLTPWHLTEAVAAADALIAALAKPLAVLLLVLLPSLAFAQAPDPTGMAPWAFRVAMAGQVADLVTTEIGLAQGLHEGNGYMHRRIVRVPLKLALPVVARWMTRKLPRRTANTFGVVVGVSGATAAGWNAALTVKWGSR